MRKRTGTHNTKEQRIGVKAEVVSAQMRTGSHWLWWFNRGLLVVGLIYLSTPFMMRPEIIKQIVYSHRVRVPFFIDHNQPAELSLNHTVNMYLTSEQGISLGLWHTVPESQWKEAQGKALDWYQWSLGDGSPIVIYLHGNTNTRAASHRVGVVKILSALGYHAFSFDYRGFGDSSGEPTEVGLTTDALYLYHWVKARSGNSPVILWGHSLGTGVTTNTAAKLMEQGIVVDGVILEGAFANARRVGNIHPFSWYYWNFPGFEYFNPLPEYKLAFPNDENLNKMRSPLLILHAEDDQLASIDVAQQLYEIAQRAQMSKNRVKMVRFNGFHGYLHNGLYKDPGLPDIIRDFVQSLAP
ncbi:hypothetical protein DPEC_G00041640 [Dallia pectoralis]|uniref:Uncharacterized protein n=1 Tax=Dallia pectoralis TaxID=75939 RepID=A0ACC2HFE6_DALPE|nr:hypothetical protein DPEC_G00041640 [Dallia pectoralis]